MPSRFSLGGDLSRSWGFLKQRLQCPLLGSVDVQRFYGSLPTPGECLPRTQESSR